MSMNITDLVTPSVRMVALGEPVHQEPAFQLIRNKLFAQLVEHGFTSIALETDRIAALLVNDFVRDGIGSFDAVMREGFTHGWGEFEGNRQLVAWMREYNRNRPPEQRLSFHGCDTQTENTTAPSPRRYLEHARDYLKLDIDLTDLLGDDERWHREAAILDATQSIGDTADAHKLRSIAEDMLATLEAQVPASQSEWLLAKIHLSAGLDLLRYHKQAAQRLDQGARIERLLAVRDRIIARNLLEIRDIEARRGPTLVSAHNLHLQHSPSTMAVGDWQTNWICAGAIVGAVLAERYVFVAGTLGRSDVLGLGEPAPDTYEGALQARISGWGLTTDLPTGTTRTDVTPRQGYLPLVAATLDGADAVLHISDGASVV